MWKFVLVVGTKREKRKYFKKRSTKRFVFFKELFIYFVLTYVYVSSWLLSLENIYAQCTKILSNITIFHRCNRLIGLVGRVFANGPGDLGSIPGRVIRKTLKMVLDTSLLNTQQFKVRIEGKVEQSRKGVASSSTPWCSSYWKGGLLVALD